MLDIMRGCHDVERMFHIMAADAFLCKGFFMPADDRHGGRVYQQKGAVFCQKNQRFSSQ